VPYKDKVVSRNYHRDYYLKHRERLNAATRKSYQKHKEERRLTANYNRLQVRIEVLTYYGKGRLACTKCGYDDFRALTLDHIEGGGKEAERQRKGTNLAPWLKRRGFPQGIQTLCMNCQFIKKIEEKEQTKR
jgi:hypothetical protein